MVSRKERENLMNARVAVSIKMGGPLASVSLTLDCDQNSYCFTGVRMPTLELCRANETKTSVGITIDVLASSKASMLTHRHYLFFVVMHRVLLRAFLAVV